MKLIQIPPTIMKKNLLLIALITLPVLTFGQKATNTSLEQNEGMTLNVLTLQEQPTNEVVLGTFTKTDVNNLSYKKSNDLISIKAYRKSLQIKTKEIKSC